MPVLYVQYIVDCFGCSSIRDNDEIIEVVGVSGQDDRSLYDQLNKRGERVITLNYAQMVKFADYMRSIGRA